MVPIEPYKTLYLPKLFTNNEKPIDEMMLRKVVVMVPGEFSFHLFSTDGAYLKMKPMVRKMSKKMNIHLVLAIRSRQLLSVTSYFSKAPWDTNRIK